MSDSGSSQGTLPDVDGEFLKSVLDGIKDSIKIIDRGFNLVYTNQTGLETVGKPLAEVVGEGHKCFSEFYQSQEQCSFCIVKEVRASGLPAFHSFSVPGVGGAQAFKEISVFPLSSDNGVPEYFIEIIRDVTALKGELEAGDEFSSIISEHQSMRDVFEMMSSVAPTDATVLIRGETGTGKELVARAIHTASRRSQNRFVAINCGAMTESLLETELFGHEKGAFTGAEKKRIGKFELADKGTLFLDEIGTISPGMQVKILRALQEGEITRVGGNENVSVDLRVICATNVDLHEEVKKGAFREDLFYRINVVPVTLPPLRERTGDIELLAKHYLKKFNEVIGKNLVGFTDTALAEMKRYGWPGNVRELRNLVERGVILSKGPYIERLDLPGAAGSKGAPVVGAVTGDRTMKDIVSEAERAYLMDALKKNQGNINKTAEYAGVNTRTIHRKMQEFGIRKEVFKEQ